MSGFSTVVGVVLGASVGATGLLTAKAETVEKAMIMIRENDPRNIFAKGYAAVTDGKGNIIPDTSGLIVGNSYDIRMRDGSFTASVTDIDRKGPSDGR